MTKVITRREVNDLIEGTFVDDLDKAVLYGELSENPNFVINEVNSESGLRYTQEQALLDADIRKAGSVTVTLTPASVTVLSTDTQMVFNISTGGTGTITGWAIVSATLDNVDRSSSTSFDSSHSKVTMTIPANTGFNSKQGRVKISVTTSDGTFESNFATCTQNAVGSLSFANPTSTQDSTAVTTTQAFTNHNCSNVGVASTSAGVTASISGGNVVINFPQNESSDPVTRTVTISGTTPDGTSAQSTHTITQNAASDITVSFEYTGENLPSSSGSISEEEFSIILENATLVSIAAPEEMEIETGGTVESPTLSVTSYPANPTESEVEYTIELTAEDVYRRSITRRVTITQNSDEYRFLLVPETMYVNADDTEGEFGVDYENVYDIVISAYDETITNAYYEETVTVEFPENDEPQSRDMSITLSGVTAAGRPVTASGVVRQSAGGDEYTFELSPVSQYLDSLDTTAEFSLTTVNVSNIGYYDRDSFNITGVSNLTENSVTATGITINQTDEVKSIYLALSGQTRGGQTVYATGSTLQDSDRYSFSLAPSMNVIPASATTAVFDIYKSNVDNIGYYAPDSSNVSGIANLTNYSVTATGISENTGSSEKTIVLCLSGETHAGRTVYESGVTTQSAAVPSGTIEVASDSDYHLDGDPGSRSFTVSWTGLKVGSNITLSSSDGMSNIYPDSISVESVDGSETVEFDYSSLSSGARRLTLEATGIDGNNTSIHDSDYYVQHGIGGTSGSSLSVDAVTIGPVTPETTSVTFRVEWSEVYDTINLTPSIGTASPSTIEANGSNTRDITVTMGANEGSSSRMISLTGETDFNDLSDDASIEQSAHVTTHELIVTSNSYSIASDGTARMTATYKTYVDGVETDSVDVTTSTTWSDDSQYASISPEGLLTANNSTSGSITVRVTGAYNGETDYVDITIGAYVPVYNPDIWWTKTYDGPKSTEVTSVDDVPALTNGEYSGEDVIYTIFINYNSEVSTVSLDDSSLSGIALADISDSVVTITVPENTTLSPRSLGSLTVIGTTSDETASASATLTIVQEAGVSGDIYFLTDQEVVGSHVQETYNGRPIEISTYFGYRNVSVVMGATVTSGDEWLSVISTTTGQTNYVSLSCLCNPGSERRGEITITGIGFDGETVCSDTVIILQLGGDTIHPYLLIENYEIYTENNVPVTGHVYNYDLTHQYVGDIGYGNLYGNTTSVTISQNEDEVTMGVSANTLPVIASGGCYVTGHTVFGDSIAAIIRYYQEWEPYSLEYVQGDIVLHNTNVPGSIYTSEISITVMDEAGLTFTNTYDWVQPTGRPWKVDQGGSSDIGGADSYTTHTSTAQTQFDAELLSFSVSLATAGEAPDRVIAFVPDSVGQSFEVELTPSDGGYTWDYEGPNIRFTTVNEKGRIWPNDTIEIYFSSNNS